MPGAVEPVAIPVGRPGTAIERRSIVRTSRVATRAAVSGRPARVTPKILYVNEAPVWLSYLPIAALALVLVGEVRRVPPTRVEAVIVRYSRLLNIPDGMSVAVTIDGRPVRNASIVVMRITNTGKTPLPAASWESSLDIELSSGSLISARQVAARPAGLRVDITALKNKARIQPLLLNAGDVFDVQLVCEDMLSFPAAHARITNVAGIKMRRHTVYNPGNGPDGALITSNKVFYFGIFPAFFVLIAFLGVFAPAEPGVPSLAVSASITLLVLYFGFLRLAVRRSQRWRPVERF